MILLQGRRWRWVFLILSLLALAWTIALIWNAWPDLRAKLPFIRVHWLLVPLAGAILSSYLAFEVFYLLFASIKPGRFSRLQLAHLYFTAQLMKHLPGRVWGVAYQFSAGGDVAFSEWVSVNTAYMLLTVAFAIWMAGVVLTFAFSGISGTLVLLTGAGFFFLFWNHRAITGVLHLVRKIPNSLTARLGDTLSAFAEADVAVRIRVLLVFAASWGIYVASWAGYGLAWPGLLPRDAIELCAIYTVAWLAGYLSFITPSGLGVRELVFVTLAKDFPADAVAGMAVFGRAMLLIVDSILGIAFGPFSPQKGVPKQGH